MTKLLNTYQTNKRATCGGGTGQLCINFVEQDFRFNNIVPKPPIFQKSNFDITKFLPETDFKDLFLKNLERKKQSKNYTCGNGFITKITRNKAKQTTKKTTYFNRTDFSNNKKPPTKTEYEEFVFTNKNKSKISDLSAIAKQEYNLLNTITLTIREKYSTDFNINCDVFRNRLLKSFIQSLSRALKIKQSEFFYFWKLELTKKNIPHIHFITTYKIDKFIINNVWNKVVRNYLYKNNYITSNEKKVWLKEMSNFNNQISTKGSQFLLYPNCTDFTKKSGGSYFYKMYNNSTKQLENKQLNTNNPQAVSRYVSKDVEVNLNYIENEIELQNFTGKLFDCSNYANKLFKENTEESKLHTSKIELQHLDNYLLNRIQEQKYNEAQLYLYDYSTNYTKFNTWENEELNTFGCWCSNYSLLEFLLEYIDIEQEKVQRLININTNYIKNKAKETKDRIQENRNKRLTKTKTRTKTRTRTNRTRTKTNRTRTNRTRTKTNRTRTKTRTENLKYTYNNQNLILVPP